MHTKKLGLRHSQHVLNAWRPSAPLEILQRRAAILQQIRHFFAERKVLEVETPLLCRTSVTDPFIDSVPALVKSHQQSLPERFYLQTSPEYAMKRLLAAGSGAIYQINKAFRQSELSQCHQIEFTMLEWYRPNFNHHDLMQEVKELLQATLGIKDVVKKTYAELFQAYLNINPHETCLEELQTCAHKQGIAVGSEITTCDEWLMLLMAHCIEPQIGNELPCFVYDFPVTQAALAKIQTGNPPVAARFEVYYKGLELANGFYELQDAKEQLLRFEKNISLRKQLALPHQDVDEFFICALTHGLPDCSGVALGIDRLVMLSTGCENISEVISFDFKRV